MSQHTTAATAPGPHSLVTGTTGYIGGRLVPELLDVMDAASVGRALRGIDVAYYLVPSLGTGRDFEAADRRAARVFADQARAAKVRRVVYLGGLTPAGVPDRALSPHLRSRDEVGRILLRRVCRRPCCGPPSSSGRAPPPSRCCAISPNGCR